MKKKIFFLSVIILVAAFAVSPSYWHQLPMRGGSSTYNVVGDSTKLYASATAMNRVGKIEFSTDLGNSWHLVFEDSLTYEEPFSYFRGFRNPAPGYMYLLYSDGLNKQTDSSTAIVRFDEEAGIPIDTIKFFDEWGQCDLRHFVMQDSISGFLYCQGQAIFTRDGWKSHILYSMRDVEYNEDSTGYKGQYNHPVIKPVMLSKDSFFFLGYDSFDYWTDKENFSYNFFMMVFHPDDSTLEIEKVYEGINIQISADSVIKIRYRDKDIYNQKFPSDWAYINDSTWVYKSPGKKTGQGDCKTLEIFKTTNRGETYRQVCDMDIRSFGLQRIEMRDSLFGIAAGNGGILITKDGGETWQVDSLIYDYDWEPYTDPFWAPRISYVDDMAFIGTFDQGLFKYEEEFGVGIREEQTNLQSPLVYPNPIAPGETINFDFSGRFDSANLQCNALIYDLSGRHIQEIDFYGNSFRLTDDIAPGTYFVVLMSGDEVIAREKINVK
jgi:hypothetical protein